MPGLARKFGIRGWEDLRRMTIGEINTFIGDLVAEIEEIEREKKRREREAQRARRSRP